MTDPNTAPVVMKFGGSSLADAGRIAGVAALVAARHAAGERPVVVASAMGGVTDALLGLAADAAAERDPADALAALRARHLDAARTLAPDDDALADALGARFDDLGDLLRGVATVGEASPRATDRVLHVGERSAVGLLAAALAARGVPARAVAPGFVRTDSAFGAAAVDDDATAEATRAAVPADAVPVLPGFLALDPDGRPTTLGRGGSDYTAALVGAALGARAVEIWTDVDGVLTADPRLVEDAFPVPAMTYAEAAEMAHFGAKVLFPPTMRPAMAAGVPIIVKNTFAPDAPGTTVSDVGGETLHAVRGLASVPRVAMLTLSGGGLVGVPGAAGRLFGALGRAGVSVVLITQASSENAIGCVVTEADAGTAREAVEAEFAAEIARGSVAPVELETGLSVLAVVGEGMKRQPGVAGRVFSALGANGVNVRAIAQGSSERNISVVVAAADEAKALGVVHGGLFLSEAPRVNLFVIGTGLVGSALLDQLAAHADEIRGGQHVDLRLAGVSNSRAMAFAARGLDLADWRAARDAGEPAAPDAFVDRMLAMNLPNTVLVDATAGPTVPALYERALAASVAVVTPNKVALSSGQALYDRLTGLAARRGVALRTETNVGAGLPVLSTLRDLVASGDRVSRVEGVLSGSLSFLFATFGDGRPFSAVVREAQARGYTEPDPRDDLSGADVARKLLILARGAGVRAEPEAAEVVPFLPAACFEAPTVEAFYAALEAADAEMEARRSAAAAAGQALRAVGTVDVGRGTMRLAVEAVGPDHPAFALAPGDNLVAFTTGRYAERPLVVRGPGAGAEVTAAGVLAEIVQVGTAIRQAR